jgi:hypothetical protein
MNVQLTNEIRELTVEEMDAVTGGSVKMVHLPAGNNHIWFFFHSNGNMTQVTKVDGEYTIVRFDVTP